MHLSNERSNDDVLAAVAGQTIPLLFAETVERYESQPALRWKSGRNWHEWTWRQYADRALRTAGFLREAGVGRGDRVAIMLRNRPEFHAIDMGCYLAGATPFSIYNSSSPEQVQYLLDHSEARIAFVDAPFAKTVNAVAPAVEPLREVVVVVDDEAPEAATGRLWGDLIDTAAPVTMDAADAVSPDDVATFIYTSGTTGPPKAVMLTHANICWLLEALIDVVGIELHGRRMLSYLPMAHVAERVFTHYLPARTGAEVTTCPDPAAVGQLLPEVRPEAFFGPPRVFEKTRAALITQLSASPTTKDALERGLELGRQLFDARAAGVEPDPAVQDAWDAIDASLLSEIRAKVGLGDCRVAFTGAAPPPVEVLEFFNFIGVPLSEVYGLSEDTGLMTAETRHPRLGTVGRPIPGCEIKLLDDGEILCRGGHVFRGYYKDREKTDEMLDSDGWLHSGDIGVIEDGYLKIVDRKKELLITGGGKNISPANIEAGLKTIPLVGQACAIGDRRPYVTALLVLDPEVAPQWAADHGLGDLSLHELASHDAVREEIERGVQAANEHLSNVERVKKFSLIGDEWQPDSDLLTPTMKLKRRGILARYEREIDELYDS